MKESAKKLTIKFHQPKNSTPLGPCPMGNRRQGEEKIFRKRERAMKRKQMGNGRGFTMGDGPLLTPIFAKRKKDGEITLQGPRSIPTNIKLPLSPSAYTHDFMWSNTI